MVIRSIVLFIFCILIKDTVLFGEELSSGEEAKIVPQKFLGSWTAYSRNHMAISGDMVLSQNQIEFSKKGRRSFRTGGPMERLGLWFFGMTTTVTPGDIR